MHSRYCIVTKTPENIVGRYSIWNQISICYMSNVITTSGCPPPSWIVNRLHHRDCWGMLHVVSDNQSCWKPHENMMTSNISRWFSQSTRNSNGLFVFLAAILYFQHDDYNFPVILWPSHISEKSPNRFTLFLAVRKCYWNDRSGGKFAPNCNMIEG